MSVAPGVRVDAETRRSAAAALRAMLEALWRGLPDDERAELARADAVRSTKKEARR